MPHATSVRSGRLDAGGVGNGASAGYDQSLLATTPEVSRAAKQESYNVDLLENQSPTTHVLEGPGGPVGLNDPVNKEISYSSHPSRVRAVAFGDDGGYRHHDPPRRPWYRRPVGIITIAVVFIIIVGAVVGGAVGGTVGQHKNNNSPQQQQQGVGPSSSQNGQGTNGEQQGVGQVGSAPIGTPSGSNSTIPNDSTTGSQSTTGQQNVGGL